LKVELFGGDKVVGVSALITVPSSALLDEDAARSTLGGDLRSAVQALRKDREANDGGPAVAVMTTVRSTEAVEPKTEVSKPRQVSSWYSRTPVWKAELESAKSPERDGDAEQISSSHAHVPQDLPVRVPGERGSVQAADSDLAREQLSSPIAQPPPESDREPEIGSLPAPWFSAQDRPTASVGALVAWPRTRPEARSRQAEKRDAAADRAPETSEPAVPPDAYVYTEDGLPMRKEGTHIRRALADNRPEPDKVAEVKAIERDPARMRRRLSSYQLGVQKAKEQEGRMRAQRYTSGWTILERRAEK
jgi:hypothetical protein